jgi:hypothetical protein
MASDFYKYELNLQGTSADTHSGLRNHINYIVGVINRLNIVLTEEQISGIESSVRKISVDPNDMIDIKRTIK